jgi:hypothetical protein
MTSIGVGGFLSGDTYVLADYNEIFSSGGAEEM